MGAEKDQHAVESGESTAIVCIGVFTSSRQEQRPAITVPHAAPRYACVARVISAKRQASERSPIVDRILKHGGVHLPSSPSVA